MAGWLQRRNDRDATRQTQQLKEIAQLGTTLRPDMSMQTILRHVITSINRTTGFQMAALNFVSDESDVVEIAATAGVTPEQEALLKQNPPKVGRLKNLMREDFRRGNCYFISHQHIDLYGDMLAVKSSQPAARSGDAWDPEDVLLVPLMSPRDGHMFAILSLDAPSDGKIPTPKTIETIEMFAHEAAHSIEIARMFQDHEREREALRSGLRGLLQHIRQVKEGDLSGRSYGQGDLLGPLSQALNDVLTTHTQIFDEVRGSAEVVEQSAGETRANAELLADAAQQQAVDTLEASNHIDTMARNLREIEAATLSAATVAEEWSKMTAAGHQAATEAAQGMQRLREAVLESAHKIKRLGERAQEVEQSVRLVADVANRTNVLALNAAIAAARSGTDTQGSLDKLVQDVRALANGSAEAAREIAERMEQMRDDTRAAVASIERSSEEVATQAKRAAEASGALHQMHATNDSLKAAVGTASQTATALGREASGMAYDIADLAHNSATMRERMEHMRNAMSLLKQLAESLRAKVSLFHLGTLSDLSASGPSDPSRPSVPDAVSDERPATVSRGFTSPRLSPLPDVQESAEAVTPQAYPEPSHEG